MIGFSGRLKRRGPADSAYGQKRNVHRLDGGRIAAAGAGAVSRDGDGSAFLPPDIATSATLTAGDSTRSCGGPQVPTFVQRPGTPTPTHCTTSLQPHYSTFRHVAWCGVGVVCLVLIGRTLALVGHHAAIRSNVTPPKITQHIPTKVKSRW